MGWRDLKVWQKGVIVGLVLLILISGGCIIQNGDGWQIPSVPIGGKPSAPFDVKLEFSEEPLLGEEVTVAVSTTSPLTSYTLRDITLYILLPEGLEYIEGDLSWHGDIEPLETKKIQAKVKVVKEGLWTVAGVSMQLNIGAHRIAPMDEVFLDVKKDKTTLLKQIKPSTPSDLQLGAKTTTWREGENRTTPPPTSPPPYKETSLPYLQFGAALQINKTVPLSFVLIPSRDVEGVDVDVLLPDGLEYVSGDISWKGDIEKYQKVEIISLVRLKRDGDYVVRGVIKNTSSGGLMQGTTFIPRGFEYGTDNLFFAVSEEDVIIQRYNFYLSKQIRNVTPISIPPIKEGAVKTGEK